MTFTEISPSDYLKDIVHSYWKFEIPPEFNNGKPFLFEVMPENKLSIVIVNAPHFNGVTCLGVQAKRMQKEIFPGSVFLGIRFNPWIGINGLFDEKLTTSNQITTLPYHVYNLFFGINPSNNPLDFSDFEQIEKSVANLAKKFTITSNALVKYICLELEDGAKIKDFIQEIPLSIRPIQKQFKALTGITMTDYRNINKLRKTVELIYRKQENIASASFVNGYTDHSHFINTFKKYMAGTSLKKFFSQTDIINHHF